MMTPEQRVQEVELFLKNLNCEGFGIQDYLDLMDVLKELEAVIGHKILTYYVNCD